MQIHELNKKPAKINETQVNEVDLVGPNSIFNVGKQVAKNPSALLSNPAMGAAKQQAYAQSAQQSAAALAKQGYKVGSGPKTAPSPQQQYNAIWNNAGAQQMVKNLASQWKPQGVALSAKMKQKGNPLSSSDLHDKYFNKGSTPPVSEARPISDPSGLKDPTEIKLYQLSLDQAAAKAAQNNPQSGQQAQATVNQELNDYAKEFQSWAAQRLSNLGVKIAEVESNPWAKEELSKALLDIALLGEFSPDSEGANAAVIKYFNIAIATSQALSQSRQSTRATAGLGTAGAAPAQQTDQEMVAQSGVPLTAAQIEALGDAMRKSANGGTVIRDTGNELLNAIARIAGFRLGQ